MSEIRRCGRFGHRSLCVARGPALSQERAIRNRSRPHRSPVWHVPATLAAPFHRGGRRVIAMNAAGLEANRPARPGIRSGEAARDGLDPPARPDRRAATGAIRQEFTRGRVRTHGHRALIFRADAIGIDPIGSADDPRTEPAMNATQTCAVAPGACLGRQTGPAARGIARPAIRHAAIRDLGTGSRRR